MPTLMQIATAVDAVADPISKEQFESFYESIIAEVEFSPEWKNNTGYLDHAVNADIGDRRKNHCAKTVDDMGRRVILVSTHLGNVVLFERYTPGEGPFLAVWNVPHKMRRAGVCTGRPSAQDLRALKTDKTWGLISEYANDIVASEDLQYEYCLRVYGLDLNTIPDLAAV